jgi:hypothetical protein
MRESVKIVLIVTGAIVLALAVVATAIGWMWHSYAPDLIESATNAIKLGKQEGKRLAEAQCLADAIQRHKNPENLNIGASVNDNLRMRGCLDVSRISAEFCTEVPAKDSILDAAVWGAKRCSAEGLSDPYCGNLFQQVVQYCSSNKHASKLPSDDAR